MDPDKWESCDPNDTSGVMISNLPLLFVNGMPTALQLMTVEDFEKFIPFMVHCSTGEAASVPWSQLPRPPWWPARLPFRIPSTTSSVCNKTIMVRIVERCYSYHGCPYLLQFCASLMEVMPSCGYRFTDNRDGTSSMYHGTTGKLLVTFRNENRDYDKVPDPSKTPQKKLISSIHHGKEKKKNIMVRPPISDVYLCDKCDDEFQSLKEVHLHEKQCGGNSSLLLSIPSPEPEVIDDVLYTDEQAPFLSQFRLMPTKNSGIEPYVSPTKKERQPLKTVSYNHFHFDSVDVSSPFGRLILGRLRNYGTLALPQHNVMRYERHIYAPIEDYEESKRRQSNRWIVTYRRKRKRGWAHLYCFTEEQKDERRRTIATGLNYRSRCLLPKCKPLIVKLKRLSESAIRAYAPREPTPSFPLIDLTKLNGVKEASTNNGNIIRVPIQDPLALFSKNGKDASEESCQRIWNNKDITITKVREQPATGSHSGETLSASANGNVAAPACSNESSYSKYNNNKKACIEIIDLLSDDEDTLNRSHSSPVVNGTLSKNGPSHWSPKNSCELGRSSRDLINGSSPSILSFSPDTKKSLLSFDEMTDAHIAANKAVLANIENTAVSGTLYDFSSDLSDGGHSTVDGKLAKRQRSEVLRLKSDECRELNQNGLNMLHDFNGCSRKILTRRLARNKMPTLTTRNSKFVIKPLLKTQLIFDTLRKSGRKLTKNVTPPKTPTLDENGNTKTFPVANSFLKHKKDRPIKRPPSHSYGRSVSKRPRLARELLSLSQDECKEIRCRGFHPADLIRVVNGIQCEDAGGQGRRNVHSVLLNNPGSYFLSTKKLYNKVSLLAIDENLPDSNLLSDASKTRSIEKDNIYRQLYLLNNSKLHSPNVHDLVNWTLTSNTRPQAKQSVRIENPRRAHRQLINSQSGMCVLSYHLPRLR